GNQTWLKGASREMWSLNSIETLIQDLRYGARMLVKNPIFTLIAVLTLSLGIGANTAIFSVVNRVLLFRLPYKDADRLVMVWGANSQLGGVIDLVSPADLADWRAQKTVFEDLAPTVASPLNLSGMCAPETINRLSTSAHFF